MRKNQQQNGVWKLPLGWMATIITTIGLLGISSQAAAFKVDTSPEWTVNWDNSILYNLGIRTQNIHSSIGNNPAYSESDYKFPNRGDVVMNRIQNLSEIDIDYMQKYGARLSGSIWKDYAYNSSVVEHNPLLSPALYGNRSDGHYHHYTERYYEQGAEFLDAFVYANFTLNNQPGSFRIGRLTQFWGNALFYGGLGISYAQNPTDGLKGLQAPGSTAKELLLPRLQVLMQVGLTDSVSVSGQVFGEWRQNRLPEGGTFFGGPPGFQWIGPDRFSLAPGFFVKRGNDVKPDGNAEDWGVKLDWRVEALNGGNVGFYYRKLSETQPWFLITPNLSEAHQAFGKDVTLYGISLDTSLGDDSVGIEASVRKDTALYSSAVALPTDPLATEAATGNTFQLLYNQLGAMPSSPLYSVGSYGFEFAYQRLLSVTKNKSMFAGINTPACPGGVKEGCSTKNSLGMAVTVKPMWLGVFPGVNLDMPMFLQYQLKGNTLVRSSGTKEKNLTYSIGLHAQVNGRYDATLTYTGFHAPEHGQGGKECVNPAGNYYCGEIGATGFGIWNDRARLILTLATTF